MIQIATDASYRPQTQEAGLGIVLSYQGQRQEVKAYLTQVADNHVAEFMAVHQAFLAIGRLAWPKDIIMLQSDSQVVVESLNKGYVKNPLYQPYLQAILGQVTHPDTFFVKWVSDRDNLGADHLARKAVAQEAPVLYL